MIGLEFYSDRFGMFLSGLFLLIGLMSFIYALVTIRQRGHRLEYYISLLLIVASGIGVALAKNLLVLFVFWEISTFAVWRAVGFYREEEGLNAALTTFIINFLAAALMLVGFAVLYVENGTLNIPEISRFNIVAAVLIMVGILAKSVTMPMHVWLVPAYRSIPSAIGGCLVGIAENLGVVLFFRLFGNNAALPPQFFTIFAWIAIISSLIGAGAALSANQLRNLLAYSTISQLGFILLGFVVGGTYGTVGAILYILAHSLAKAGLFYGVGLIEDVTGEADMRNISCMMKVSPVLALSMAVLAGSIIGIFPMIGFFPKLMVIVGAVESNIYLGVAAIVIAIFTLSYNVRFYDALFFGEQCSPTALRIKKLSYTEIAVVFILAMLSLLTGIVFFEPLNYFSGGF